jgi:hypothetical protein
MRFNNWEIQSAASAAGGMHINLGAELSMARQR